jgi:hypothetical protein
MVPLKVVRVPRHSDVALSELLISTVLEIIGAFQTEGPSESIEEIFIAPCHFT